MPWLEISNAGQRRARGAGAFEGVCRSQPGSLDYMGSSSGCSIDIASSCGGLIDIASSSGGLIDIASSSGGLIDIASSSGWPIDIEPSCGSSDIDMDCSRDMVILSLFPSCVLVWRAGLP